MTEALSILLPPLSGCVLLVMMHVYFGVHVLERGIVFVDLALAQFIGLGIAVSFLFDIGPQGSRWFSLVFALAGASVLATSRYISRVVYIEAFIGVLYVFSLAASMLVLDRTPHGLEEFKAILNGNILWINGGDVWRMFALYACVGVFHYVFRRRFADLSFNGLGGPLWEFLFFLSFALVLTSSVKVAGILQVFVFLILPVLVGRLYCKGVLRIMLVGWAAGVVTSAAGIAVSYVLDLPTSPVIVAMLCLIFFALLAVRLVRC